VIPVKRTLWIATVLGLGAVLSVMAAAAAADGPPANVAVATVDLPGRPVVLRASTDGEERVTAGLHLIESTARAVVLDLVTDLYTIDRVTAADMRCDAVRVDGYTAVGDAGWPELPARVATLGIPPGAQITLEVIDTEFVDVPGTYSVCPAPVPVQQRADEAGAAHADVRLIRDPEAYLTQGFLPHSAAEIALTGYIRNQRVAQVRFHPIQYEPTTGRLRHLRRIRIRLGFGGVRTALLPAADGLDEIAFDGVLKQLLLNYEAARAFRSPHVPSAARSQPEASEVPPYRVLVDQDGMYALSCADLYAAGIPTDTLDPRTLKVLSQGVEVAIQFEGEQDGSCDAEDTILFYGQQARTRFTRTNVYWLDWGGATGARMWVRDGTPQGWETPSHFRSRAHVELNTLYVSGEPSGPDRDRWYWSFVGASSRLTETYTIEATSVATDAQTATVRGLLKGYDADPLHHTIVYLNGCPVTDTTWSAQGELLFEEATPHDCTVEGTNTISVVAAVDMGITGDYFLPNWFEIDYGRRFEAVDDVLHFGLTEPGLWDIRVSGFQTDSVEILEVTDPLSPTRLTGWIGGWVSDTHVITFSSSLDAERHYLALANTRRLEPLAIEPVNPSNLRATTNGADYVIITHRDFVSAAAELSDYHAAEGMRTVVVDTRSIYDEFSHGLFDPEAIRSFLTYAYAYWESPSPTYVVLLGDGHYDFLDYLGTGETNFVPPYLADADRWMGETAADNRYVCVSGEDVLPDMVLGRLPVRTAADVAAIVAKIDRYEQGDPGQDWRRRTLCVADEGEYWEGCDELDDDHLPPPYAQQKVYHSITHGTPEAMRSDILSGINEGRLLVGYSGHASIQYWSGDKVLRLEDVAALTNTERFPVMLPMACLEGYYVKPSAPGDKDWSSLGESIVRAPAGGAVASFSPTGYGLPQGHHLMLGTLYDAVLSDGVTELGAAATAAKLAMAGGSDAYLIDNYVLLGDPALDLDVLRSAVSITKSVSPASWTGPGQMLTYTIAFTNAGPDLTGAEVTDDLHGALHGATVVSAGATITLHAGTRYSWYTGALAKGSGGTITITAIVSDTFSGLLTNTATVATTALDAGELDNVATVVTVVPWPVYLPINARSG
jgi:uncharacterized repeat protein (TIGR01451 family)